MVKLASSFVYWLLRTTVWIALNQSRQFNRKKLLVAMSLCNVAEQLSNEKILRAFRGIARGCKITKTFQYQPKLTLNIE
ncbi:MAG: hypothetical protein V1897_16030 [Pseudomonadota bacterium]